MGDRIELAGRVFGLLTVIERSGRAKRMTMWRCKCECGQEVVAQGYKLRRGIKQSCDQKRHRQPRLEEGDRLAKMSWSHMHARCSAIHGKHYLAYAGRGISVCERWAGFPEFLSDMGPRPSQQHSIERINNDGDYEPGNCRWVLDHEQRRNKRHSHYVEWEGARWFLADLCRFMKIDYPVVFSRLKNKWGLRAALLTPVRPSKRRR